MNQSIATTGKRQRTQATNLIRSTSMAPSQQAKMFQIENITAKVIPTIAKAMFVKAGIVVQAGEKFFGVQSAKFLGWAYIVAWDTTREQYVCSCGNPRCTEHVGAVREYTASKYAA